MIASLLIGSAMMAAAAPNPINPAKWATIDDYPKEALERGQQGFPAFRLTVSPDGKPQRCQIVESSGFPALDAGTCALIQRRAKFRPALDEAGQPMVGVYRGYFAWRFPGAEARPVPTNVDLETEVSRLPDGVRAPALVTVNLIVDPAGRIESCAAQPSKVGAQLGDIACEQTASRYRPAPALDANNRPVKSVQTASIAFAPKKAAQ
jgi:TonB family protein